jgi:c-di-GMP-binding flagellar brake protein YcgR
VNEIEELSGSSAETLLSDAANRNFAVSVDLKDGDRWLRYPSRFLALRRGRPSVLGLELPAEPATGRPVRLAAGRRMIVNFTIDGQRFRFATVVIQPGWFKLASGNQVEGVSVTCPPSIQRLQRRAAYRHYIPLTQLVVVQIWQGGQAARDMALAGGEPTFLGRLHNVSTGGLCVRLYGRANPGVQLNELLGLEFELDDKARLRLDGRVRRCQLAADGSVELGVQFTADEQSYDARCSELLLARRMEDYQQQTGLRRVG